jgi:hypothetical protein
MHVTVVFSAIVALVSAAFVYAWLPGRSAAVGAGPGGPGVPPGAPQDSVSDAVPDAVTTTRSESATA